MNKFEFFQDITLDENGAVQCILVTEPINENTPGSMYDYYDQIQIEDGKLKIIIRS